MQKIQWFFGTEKPQRGRIYDSFVAVLDEESGISLKKFQIPRIDFEIFIMYENYAGQQIFSVYPNPNDVFELNILRMDKNDTILLGMTKPIKGQPYEGYEVKAKDGNIITNKYRSTPLKEIIMPGISRFNCNKQFYVIIDADGNKHLLETV